MTAAKEVEVAGRQRWDPSSIGRRYDLLADWMERLPWYSDPRVVEVVLNLLPPDAVSCLELCCGAGHLLADLQKARKWERLTGVDASHRMVELARNRLGESAGQRVVEGDWIAPLEREEPYDVIIVKNALHLLPDVVQRLRLLHRVRSTRTCLIVVETVSPNKESNTIIRDVFRAADPEGPKAHLFRSHSLRETLRLSGWPVAGTVRLRQRLDVQEWLSHKCTDQRSRRCVEEILSRCSSRVRRSMQFDPEATGTPSWMLRSQMISYSWNSAAARARQLELLADDQPRQVTGEPQPPG